MTLFISSVIKLITIFTLLISSTTVFAGSVGAMTMSFAATGGAESIPSLSGMMLVVLSLLLFAIALRTAKQKEKNKLFVSLIGTGALLTALGGAGQLKTSIDAYAGWTMVGTPVGVVPFDRDNTTQELFVGIGTYINQDPELTATILDINNVDFCSIVDTGNANQCSVGQTLAPGASCELEFGCGFISLPDL